jgi:hypothetical protein
MAPTPIDSKLYDQVVAQATLIFKSTRGIYRSAWIVKEYKRLGGTYTGKQPSTKDPGLRRWFKEKWIDLNRPIYGKSNQIIGYEPCGRADAESGKYPLCRPLHRVTADTPKTVNELSAASIKQAKADKKKIESKGNIRFKTK